MVLLVPVVAALAGGCGKPSPDEDVPDGMNPVLGAAAFGSQCPLGTMSPMVPARIGLWDCPEANGTVELTQPPQPLILSADCKEKSLTVRSADGVLDSSWEVMPDGAFNVSMSPKGLATHMRIPGRRGDCTAYSTVDMWGKLDCRDRDKVNIKVDVVWWVGKGTRPAETSSAGECGLPPSCYLHSSATLRQCQ